MSAMKMKEPWNPAAILALSVLLTCIMSQESAGNDTVQSDRKPNVLFIAIDDLNDWNDVLKGNPQARTPQMDRLASKGITFTNAHCAAPACGPSRSAIMSGIRPCTSGNYINKKPCVKNFPPGIRVPFAMRWKGRLPAGAVYHSPIHSLDILPTALGAAGASVPSNVDGVNLLPFLRGESDGDPHEYLYWRSGRNAAVRKGKWKLLLGDNLECLYDLETDPGESNDRSAAEPAVASELREAFGNWNGQLPKTRRDNRKVTTEFNGDKIEWDI